MSKFALVSTVDTMGPGFPCQEIFVFETKKEAVAFSVALITKHDSDVQWIEDECQWVYGDDHYEDPEDLLANWQEGLESVEFFHIFPVANAKPAPALNRQCRFVLDDGVVTHWYSFGNVTFFDAIRQHCRESGLASKYRVNIVEVRCESDPEKIDRFEVQARIDWDILNPRLGAE